MQRMLVYFSVLSHQLNVMLNKNQELCTQLINNDGKKTKVVMFDAITKKLGDGYFQPFIFIFCFALLLLLIRVFLRGSSLEMDEAEQILMGQHLQWGYPFQPPLYTWLQYGVFQIFGYHLFSIALLKYLLLAACLYCYYQICQDYCSNIYLARCAMLAWVFFIPISFDLLKDNTHSILALLAACMTWKWFSSPGKLPLSGWYFMLGLIITTGFLAKFNYLLFLLILVISALCLQEERQKLMNWRLLITLGTALILCSPYLWWLYHHLAIGLKSAGKLAPQDKQIWQGIFELFKATFAFISPMLLVTALFFPLTLKKSDKNKTTNNFLKSPGSQTLLRLYHWLCIPLICLVMLGSGFRDFQTRWLIPILFLTPLVYFSRLNQDDNWQYKARWFTFFCLVFQFLLIAILIGRAYWGHHLNQQVSIQRLEHAINQSCPNLHNIVSDSPLLLGNLFLLFPESRITLQTSIEQPPPPSRGNVLLIWEPGENRAWVDAFKSIISKENGAIIGQPQTLQPVATFICIRDWKYGKIFPQPPGE